MPRTILMVSTEAGASVPLCNLFRLAFRRITKDYLIGIGLLLVVVVLWTSSSFITQVSPFFKDIHYFSTTLH